MTVIIWSVIETGLAKEVNLLTKTGIQMPPWRGKKVILRKNRGVQKMFKR